MRKYGYTKNPWSSLSKPSPSQDEENRSQGVEFLERSLQSWSSLSDNFGESPGKLVTLGWSRARKKRRQKSGKMVKEPETRAETPVEIGQNKLVISHGNNQETFPDNLGTPSNNVGNKNTLKTRADPSREFPDRTRLRSQRNQIS